MKEGQRTGNLMMLFLMARKENGNVLQEKDTTDMSEMSKVKKTHQALVRSDEAVVELRRLQPSKEKAMSIHTRMSPQGGVS